MRKLIYLFINKYILNNNKAYHGGAFFNKVGSDFSTLHIKDEIINADVLDAWFDPHPLILEKIQSHLSYLIRTSPPTNCDGLVKVIAETRGINTENILVGGGSSDIMFYLFPNLIKKGAKVMILDPMYGEYQHIFNHVVEVELHRVLLNKEDGFTIYPNELIKQVNDVKPELLVMVNPNSPTGKYLQYDDVLNIIKQIPKETLVLIDETYIEYVNRAFSLERYAGIIPNLMVIKSMSKVYALSGVRVAYFVANTNITNRISTFIPPWSVSLLGQVAGVEALKNQDYYKPFYELTHNYRNYMVDKLKTYDSIRVFNSVGNYFLIELLNKNLKANEICKQLESKNIFIRNCDSMGSQFHNNFIRLAVKNDNQNKIMLDELISLIS